MARPLARRHPPRAAVRAAWAVALAVVLVGCSVPTITLTDHGKAYTGDDYSTELRRWTRKAARYEGFLSRIFVRATYLHSSFRRAQLAHRARAERMTEADRRALQDAGVTEARAAHSFFLAAHTHEWRWNHLERTGPEALWSLRLLNDRGEAVAPTHIERIGTDDARFTALFPYYRDFYVGYRVSFPRQDSRGRDVIRPGIKWFAVRISGPQAAVDLTWQVAQ